MSGYILELRKLVGHRPLLQVGASVIVENSRGEILLEKRADNHCWGYAGGSVELDEAVEDAAKRELYEETGLIARELTLFGVFSGEGMHYVYPNGDAVSNVDVVYLCRDYTGHTHRQQGEVNRLRWFAPQDMPPMAEIMPPNRPALRQYLESVGVSALT